MSSLTALLHRIQTVRERLDIDFHVDDTLSNITRIEALLGRKLPADIQAFYVHCPGFWTNDALFRILSPGDILAELEAKGTRNPIGKVSFSIADYMIFSDVWEVELNEEEPSRYVITNTNHHTEAPIILTDSLHEFIEKFLAEGVFGEEGGEGLYAWRERIKALSQ